MEKKKDESNKPIKKKKRFRDGKLQWIFFYQRES